MYRQVIYILLLLFLKNIALGKATDTIVSPITIKEIKDGILKQEVLSILGNKNDQNLDIYKTKRKNHLSISTFRSSWEFDVQFSEMPMTTGNSKKDESTVKTLIKGPLIDNVTFYHVKFSSFISDNSLQAVNKAILTCFAGQSVSCITNAFISKDRYRNYLHISLTKSSEKLDIIFVLESSKPSMCVVERTNV